MSELRPKTLDAILDWWAQELGISGADLISTQPGVTLSGNPLLSGILAFHRGNFVRIAATPGKLERIHEVIMDRQIGQLFTAEFWSKNLKEHTGKIIGPARLYYADKPVENWKKITTPVGTGVRGLAAMDAAAFMDFLSAIPKEEREYSGLEFGPQPMWGAFVQKQLVAVAGYDAWPGKISHLCVGVRPDFRKKGLGRAVVMAAARGALARRRIVQFRALESNPAATAIAASLGLEFFAETIYLRSPEPLAAPTQP